MRLPSLVRELGVTPDEYRDILTTLRLNSQRSTLTLIRWLAGFTFLFVSVSLFGPVLGLLLLWGTSVSIWAACSLVRRKHAGRLLFAELRARGHDVCIDCGYIRTGIDPLAACPECGVRFAPLPRQDDRS